MVHRVYVEKQPPFAVEAKGLEKELVQLLGITGLAGLRVLNRYDVEGLSEVQFRATIPTVFSEPPVDTVHYALPAADALFAVEYLPGQFDQRADSAAECIQLITQKGRPTVQSARVYLLDGQLAPAEVEKIKAYVINPVEAREADLAEKDTLQTAYPAPPPVPVLHGFLQMEAATLPGFIEEYALAMDAEDLAFCQAYFRGENRAPTLTELRMIDTYWSDHCRHTTFGTQLEEIQIEDEKTEKTYQKYIKLRKELYGENTARPKTLMDLATIGAKALKAKGALDNLDESDEVNACSVKITADNDGQDEDWLLLFKNETHNHPTEIEPFGGAATCIGGAIRDPLANRGYVFGAMRVTGAASPLAPVEETLPGKLPQYKLCTTAAAGYASYGNQIGLATGQVTEIYHPGYVAKRMEVGAVLGAVPAKNVVREVPAPGDVVLLLGGRTGRDGCGGATGSSKAHDAGSLESCGAEVQKGNPPVERKLQRLFRNPAASRLIRRCNDFGAGGVSVAIGELADGVEVDLDAIPKKYDGLDGTELAISESQERMAVVVAPADVDAFLALAAEENLEATAVAKVTAEKRLVMRWQGQTIVDVARTFLASNGAAKTAAVRVGPLPAPTLPAPAGAGLQEKLQSLVTRLNVCSQKGLTERFDSTIGAASVLMPLGGRFQLTPAQAMVMKLPVEGETQTCAGMAFGLDPFISEQNPYQGAWLAVAHSVGKLVASGFALSDIRLSFQEYFERLRQDPVRWGKPFAALLGALAAQLDLGCAAIGGKDSMSGSFEELDVPPTLISFAVAPGRVENIVGNEFQLPLSRVVVLRCAGSGTAPNPTSYRLVLAQLEKLIREKQVLSAYAVGTGGIAEAVFKMCLGNRVGFAVDAAFDAARLFEPAFGSFVVELRGEATLGEVLGETTGRYTFEAAGEKADMAALQAAWEGVLEPVFPTRPAAQNKAESEAQEVQAYAFSIAEAHRAAPKVGVARPKALVPVFPGNNCEYDTARALRRAGAQAEIFVVQNLTPAQVAESAAALAQKIAQSQMVVLPGGFSGGDEPEGSAKLIAAFFRGGQVAEEVARLLQMRDGLMLGICNGFQALIKLGLLPHGKITDITPDSPTLTFNTIGRHQSMLVRTRIASNLSPWLAKEEVGAIHTIAISHGEGRFVAGEDQLRTLAENGQIATQYVDVAGKPTMDIAGNPNGSAFAIEGLTSADGRILGKMGHTERIGDGVYANVPGNKHQALFEGGVAYFAL
ncbi:phosphoribosylformylglycinamidine synthase [Ruminococcaceae bacterium OttesenSCG-928-O06]|nr:phosphoribosylformylglycinamidine synthase [Ruminococcaceae bacterium OttesenSCG-928-O06]